MMLDTRVQTDWGMSGGTARAQTRMAAVRPGRSRPDWITMSTPVTANARKPPRDLANRIAPSISSVTPAANRRPSVRPGVSAANAANGRNVTMFIARSFGFPIRPGTAPCSRSPCSRLLPVA